MLNWFQRRCVRSLSGLGWFGHRKTCSDSFRAQHNLSIDEIKKYIVRGCDSEIEKHYFGKKKKSCDIFCSNKNLDGEYLTFSKTVRRSLKLARMRALLFA